MKSGSFDLERTNVAFSYASKSTAYYEVELISNSKRFKVSNKHRSTMLEIFVGMAPDFFQSLKDRAMEVRHSVDKYNLKIFDQTLEVLSLTDSYGVKGLSMNKLIEERLVADTKIAAASFQKIRKYSSMLKNELLVLGMLSRKSSLKISDQSHNIRDVILYVYHLFEEDFKEKSIDMRLGDVANFSCKIHYDLLQCILVQLMQNAYKYTLPGESLLIKASYGSSALTVSLESMSLSLTKAEESKIFEYGYRSSNAEIYEGEGKGLFMVKRVLNLLGGDMQINRGGSVKVNSMNVEYSNNSFEFFFPSGK